VSAVCEKTDMITPWYMSLQSEVCSVDKSCSDRRIPNIF